MSTKMYNTKRKYTNKDGVTKIYNYTYKKEYNSKYRRDMYIRKKLNSFNFKYNIKKTRFNIEEIKKIGYLYNNQLLYSIPKVAKIVRINPEKFRIWVKQKKIPSPFIKIKTFNGKINNYYFYEEVIIMSNLFSIYYTYNYRYDLRYPRSIKLKSLLYNEIDNFRFNLINN